MLSEFFSIVAGQALLCACVVSYQSFGGMGFGADGLIGLFYNLMPELY